MCHINTRFMFEASRGVQHRTDETPFGSTCRVLPERSRTQCIHLPRLKHAIINSGMDSADITGSDVRIGQRLRGKHLQILFHNALPTANVIYNRMRVLT